jgi:hypothetical protein
MEFTLGEIYSYGEPLKRLTAQRLPVAVAYKVAQLKRKIMTEVALVDSQRTELVKQHGIEDDRGNFSCRPDSSGFPQFIEDLRTLFEQTVKLNDIEKVLLPQVVNGQQLVIEPEDIITLERIVGIAGFDEQKPKKKKKA